MSKISQIAQIIAGLTYGEMVEFAEKLNQQVLGKSGMMKKGVETKDMLHGFAKAQLEQDNSDAKTLAAQQKAYAPPPQASGGFGSQQTAALNPVSVA